MLIYFVIYQIKQITRKTISCQVKEMIFAIFAVRLDDNDCHK